MVQPVPLVPLDPQVQMALQARLVQSERRAQKVLMVPMAQLDPLVRQARTVRWDPLVQSAPQAQMAP